MKKPLETLDDFNYRRKVEHGVMVEKKPQSNGIACPRCGRELYDTHPNTILLSYPPQKEVHCVGCGFEGLRIA